MIQVGSYTSASVIIIFASLSLDLCSCVEYIDMLSLHRVVMWLRFAACRYY